MTKPHAPTLPLVLLFRGKGLLSLAIRWQTRGKYSHVAILLPDGRVIEAWPGQGVRLRQMSAEDWDDVDVFRVKGMTEAQWRVAIDYLHSRLGAKYDWWGVIRFISRRHMPDNDHEFCSEVAFDAIALGGVRLLERITGDEVSPQMFSLSPVLEEVA